jgi:regulator of protease activity HflC (stomatin/prohibitin superfamily)
MADQKENQEIRIKTSAQIDQIKRGMQITAKRVNFWLKVVFCILLTLLATGITFFVSRFYISGFTVSGIPLILFLWALLGFMVVQPEDRIMIEFLGRAYCIKESGFRWYLRFLMKRRRIVSTWEQPVKLFPERKYPNGIHIDLKNGGKTEVVDPILWIRLSGAGTNQEKDNILRMIYAIEDWEDAVQENGENALRTCLNNLTVDDVLTAIHDPKKQSWWDAIKEYFPGLDNVLKEYGIEATRLTISDFNWDQEVVKARQKVFEEERSIRLAELSIKAAEDEVSQKALESGGLYGKIVKLLMQKKYGELSQKQAMEAAKTLVLYYKGADTNSLVDVRTGKGDFAQLAGAVIGAVRGIKSGDQQESGSSESE